ncbi:DUF86 domain-containing protein [Nostoc sphaeroides]|jgi:uncharacterized protein with HEPN domain|uniref:DUF86 domain-containing protein n=1 Tax=Nostoc sphaeroides CCNUC1 TaxID=2653204 RepID=A0A5P8WIQ5_9NOSO|nr:HepT-like ribonuclease domain-containing protein [Nostoc sphaeroides]QFS52743.1 Protein of unknown function DUF86 [Nostoc sphaeroides CCNUC1]
MSKIDDLTRLKHIRDSAKEALSFVNNRTREDLDHERMLSLALVRLIEIMGEAANHVSEPCQAKYLKIPWRQIIGMRNRIIHAYFDVDLDIIWQVITQDLGSLLIEVEKAIKDLET